MKETGAVKFRFEYVGGELVPFPGFEELNAGRQELRRLGLLGADETGLGFGNISMRDGETDSFYITGSGTGVLPALALQDYAKVIGCDFERNWLRCEGRAIPSAESLTHAAVYSMDAEVRGVVHGHGRRLWQGLRERGFATGPNVHWGTPEMARAITACSRNRFADRKDFRNGRAQGWDRCLRPGFGRGAGGCAR
jgi:hypothetical protein